MLLDFVFSMEQFPLNACCVGFKRKKLPQEVSQHNFFFGNTFQKTVINSPIFRNLSVFFECIGNTISLSQSVIMKIGTIFFCYFDIDIYHKWIATSLISKDASFSGNPAFSKKFKWKNKEWNWQRRNIAHSSILPQPTYLSSWWRVLKNEILIVLLKHAFALK